MLCPQSRSALPEADIFDLQMIFASAASARLIERNRPSMFAHPVWSFQAMCACCGSGLAVDSMRSALAWKLKRKADSGASVVDASPSRTSALSQ
jgi:hypothetical protein